MPEPEPVPAGLDSMKKADLVAVAAERGLDTAGTRPVLIDRIRGSST